MPQTNLLIIVIISLIAFGILSLAIELIVAPPPAYTITLCDLQKNLDGVSSRYVITNTGFSAASTLHIFYENNGGLVISDLRSLAAGHSQTYSLATMAGLPDGYRGYVVIGSDQPITGSLLALPGSCVEITLGAEGGGLVYTDTRGLTTTIQSPPGAVTLLTTLLYTPVDTLTQPASPGLHFAGRAFELEAYQEGIWRPGLVFSEAVTVTLRYTDTDVAGLDENTLALLCWNGSSWASDGITAAERATASNYIALTIIHLSRYALFGSTQESPPLKVFLPVVLR